MEEEAPGTAPRNLGGDAASTGAEGSFLVAVTLCLQNASTAGILFDAPAILLGAQESTVPFWNVHLQLPCPGHAAWHAASSQGMYLGGKGHGPLFPEPVAPGDTDQPVGSGQSTHGKVSRRHPPEAGCCDKERGSGGALGEKSKEGTAASLELSAGAPLSPAKPRWRPEFL